jgi:hypothetical protein
VVESALDMRNMKAALAVMSLGSGLLPRQLAQRLSALLRHPDDPRTHRAVALAYLVAGSRDCDNTTAVQLEKMLGAWAREADEDGFPVVGRHIGAGDPQAVHEWREFLAKKLGRSRAKSLPPKEPKGVKTKTVAREPESPDRPAKTARAGWWPFGKKGE